MIDFKYDTNDIYALLNGLIDANDKAVSKTLGFLGMQIVSDAVMKPPTPRIDKGQARGSWSIKVGNNAIQYSDGTVGGYSKPSGMLTPETSGIKTYELRIGFNVPYAFNIHEGIHEDGSEMGYGLKSENATPKTGNFFLSSKFKTREATWIRRAQENYNEFMLKEMIK